MDKKLKSFDLLLSQRNQLVNDLATTNSVFHKTILAFFTGLVTIIAAESFLTGANKSIMMILIQMIIMIAIFIQALLISGNIKRYYIWAIDEYIYENYGISVLFYQGKMSREHTIGIKSLFPIITTSITCITMLLLVWIIVEYKLLGYIHNNKLYTVLVVVELILILFAMIYNFVNKFVEPKEYTDCINYLKREIKCNDENS